MVKWFSTGLHCVCRAGSTDNVGTDWGVDRSTFHVASHVVRSNLIVLKIK